MQNLDGDLKQAFLETLCGSWQVRKATLDRVFTEDAQFWCAYKRQCRGSFPCHTLCMKVVVGCDKAPLPQRAWTEKHPRHLPGTVKDDLRHLCLKDSVLYCSL